MTRELDSKSTGLTALKDSAEEPADVRALLVAGSNDDLGYDFERGLSAHLGAIGALPGPGHVSEPAPQGGSGAKGLSALSSKPLLLLLGVPAAAASIALALWLGVGARGASSKAPVARAPEKMSAPAAPVTEPPPSLAVESPAVRAVASATPPSAEIGAAAEGAPRADRGSSSAPRGSAGPVAAEHITLAESGDTAVEGPAGVANSARVAESPRVVGGQGAPSPSAARERAEEEAAEEAVRQREARAEEANRLAGERFQKEMRGLVDAKRALPDDPATALSLARQGEHDFPHGVFSEERQHILILALIRLGRLDEARRAAAPYLAQHPDSPFARRVQTALDAAARSSH